MLWNNRKFYTLNAVEQQKILKSKYCETTEGFTL